MSGGLLLGSPARDSLADKVTFNLLWVQAVKKVSDRIFAKRLSEISFLIRVLAARHIEAASSINNDIRNGDHQTTNLGRVLRVRCFFPQ